MKLSKRLVWGIGVLLIAVITIILEFSPDDTSRGTAIEPVVSRAKAARLGQVQQTNESPSGERLSPDVRSSGRDPLVSDEEAESRLANALEEIEEASTTYDPAQLHMIKPYLFSPDPNLRNAAVNAMVVLGDASAGPMLREAAQTMKSPEEAKKMESAADYVELPPIDIKKFSKSLKGKRDEKSFETVHPRNPIIRRSRQGGATGNNRKADSSG